MDFHRADIRPACAGRFILGLVLVLLAACDGGERALTATTPTPVGAQQRHIERKEMELPPRGTAKVGFEAGRVNVLGHDASRREILERLAEAADFELVLNELPPLRLTLRLEGTLETALRDLLIGLAFRVDRAFVTHQGLHVVTRLEVGTPGTVRQSVASLRPSRTGRRTLPAATMIPPRVPAEDELRRREAEDLRRMAEESAVDHAERLERMESADPTDRIAAIERLPTAGEGHHILLDALAYDEDPRVRAAAASRLFGSRGFASIQGLVAALEDPDVEVVLRAVDGLSASGDESVAWNLENALADHPDARVREALDSALSALDRTGGMAADATPPS